MKFSFNREKTLSDFERVIQNPLTHYRSSGPYQVSAAEWIARDVLLGSFEDCRRQEESHFPPIDPRGTSGNRWDRWRGIDFVLKGISSNPSMSLAEVCSILREVALASSKDVDFLSADSLERLVGIAYGVGLTVYSEFPIKRDWWIATKDEHSVGDTSPDLLSEEPSQLELELFKAVMDYGVSDNADLSEPLRNFYSAAVLRLPEDARVRVLMHVIKMAESRVASINVFNPFMFVDPSPTIISTASLHAAGVWPDKDPVAAVQTILEWSKNHMARGGSEESAVAIVSGLLMLGDRRVIDALRFCWREFSPEGRATLSKASGPRLHAPVADWLMDWLEDSEGSEFGAVAASLDRFAERAKTEGVFEVRRAIPIWEAGDGPVIQESKNWTFDAFADRIRPRLLQLAANESAPRVMHRVLNAWGIDYASRVMSGIALNRNVGYEEPRDLLPVVTWELDPTARHGYIDLEASDFCQRDGMLLVSWSVFNPYGPTWSCVGILPTEDERTDILFYRMFNPFAQINAALGRVSGENFRSKLFLTSAVASIFTENVVVCQNGNAEEFIGGGLPDIVEIHFTGEEVDSVIREAFAHNSRMLELDVRQEVDDLVTYPNAWERASKQRKEALSHINSEGLIMLPSHEPPTTDDIRRWFDLVTNDEHKVINLVALPSAWHGSIDNAAEPLAGTAFTFWELEDFLYRYGFHLFRDIASAMDSTRQIEES